MNTQDLLSISTVAILGATAGLVISLAADWCIWLIQLRHLGDPEFVVPRPPTHMVALYRWMSKLKPRSITRS